MIDLRETNDEELAVIYELGYQKQTKAFLNPKSMADINNEYLDENSIYLSVVDGEDIPLGYIILEKDKNKNAIKLRRILIGKNNIGIGQRTLVKLEAYCISLLRYEHIWLDVYDDNYRAIHIYEKLGYKLFNSKN